MHKKFLHKIPLLFALTILSLIMVYWINSAPSLTGSATYDNINHSADEEIDRGNCSIQDDLTTDSRCPDKPDIKDTRSKDSDR